MDAKNHRAIIDRVATLASNDQINRLRWNTFDQFNKDRDFVRRRFNTGALEKEVRTIKEWSIDNLSMLLKLLEERLEENDIRFILAKDAKEARTAINELIGPEKLILQSSTDTPVEIDLDLDLCHKKKVLFKTEVNHRVFQCVPGAVGFHKGSPVHYFSQKDWFNTVKGSIDPRVESAPRSLANAVVDDIKKQVKKAHIGITGANSISAADGAILLTHDFGNSALVSQLPTHIVVAGIEKVVPNLIDAWRISYLQALYSSGLGGSHYQTMIRAPSRRVKIAGKKTSVRLLTKNVAVVLLDNGRRRLIKDGFKEILYCIRYFSCHNYCPVYRILGPGRGVDYQVPGFGYKGYIGGRGVVLANFLFGSATAIDAGLFECTLCGLCYQECPLKINIPLLVTKLRNKVLAHQR